MGAIQSGLWYELTFDMLNQLQSLDESSSDNGLFLCNEYFSELDPREQKSKDLKFLFGSRFADWLDSCIGLHFAYAATNFDDCVLFNDESSRLKQHYLIAGEGAFFVDKLIDSLNVVFNIKPESIKYKGSQSWFAKYAKYFNVGLAGKAQWAKFKKHCLADYGDFSVNESHDAFTDFFAHLICVVLAR